jgi:hypothetical protein
VTKTQKYHKPLFAKLNVLGQAKINLMTRFLLQRAKADFSSRNQQANKYQKYITSRFAL